MPKSNTLEYHPSKEPANADNLVTKNETKVEADRSIVEDDESTKTDKVEVVKMVRLVTEHRFKGQV